MAAHVRKQIRAALVTALTGLSTTGNNVFAGRASDRELQASNLPALKIDTVDGGDIETLSMGGVARLLERRLVVTLTAVVKSNSTPQDTVDQIFKEVEVALSASVSANTLGGLVKHITPIGEPQIEIVGEGETTVVEGKQNFLAPYVTALNAPDAAL